MTIQTPAFLQNKAYGARTDRQILRDVFQKGVVEAGDLKVTPTATSRQVSIAAGQCYIEGQVAPAQGMYRLFSDSAMVLTHDAATTNPRIDQIIARVEDSTENGNVGGDIATIAIVKGTETAGASIYNRAGAVADNLIPKNWTRIADVRITTGTTVIPAGDIVDRRPWAKGAFISKIGQQGGDYTHTPSNTWIDTNRLGIQMECTGAPILVSARITARIPSGSTDATFQVNQSLDGEADTGVIAVNKAMTGGRYETFDINFVHKILPRRAVFYLVFYVQVNTTINSGSEFASPRFTMMEIPRQNMNDTATGLYAGAENR